MSSSTSQLPPDNHIQIVRQLYSDASLLEQSIQQHVEANKVGLRSASASLPSSPSGDRRLYVSDLAQQQQQQQPQNRRPNSVQSPQRRSSRQSQHQQQQDEPFLPPQLSSHFRSVQEELTFLRDSLKDVYESILLEDLVAAVEKSVVERLWRHVFYTPIEELRGELRKLEQNHVRRQEVMDDLSRLLDKGTGFFHELMTALRCEHDIDINTVAVDLLRAEYGTSKTKAGEDSEKSLRNKSGRSRQQSRSKDDTVPKTFPLDSLANCIHKCFLYLGDLARYRTNIRLESQTLQTSAPPSPATERPVLQTISHSAVDWQASSRFYQRALQIYPDSGKAYGQLAILASYANDDLDALYWYSLSLGAKVPSVVVRDNLKVFFSRYQNRYKDLISCVTAAPEDSKTSADVDSNSDSAASSAQDDALSQCDLSVLFIKLQMDLFAPHLDSITFRDSRFLKSICAKLLGATSASGPRGVPTKMVASLIFTVWDLYSRTSGGQYSAQSAPKEEAAGIKRAQRTGLVFLLSMATTLLERQNSLLNSLDQDDSQTLIRLDPDLLYPVQILIEFWISHWDQVWGMIRLEEKWVATSSDDDMSLKRVAVLFFRPLISILNFVRQKTKSPLAAESMESISDKALLLLDQDRINFCGLMPFRRFQSQLVDACDSVENPEETLFCRLLLFASKVAQASEGIRGTVVELSLEPISDNDETGVLQYRLLDADDKRVLRERGCKVLASHWLQDQVALLQKGLDTVDRKGSVSNQGGFNERRRPAHPRPRGSSGSIGSARGLLPGQLDLVSDYSHRNGSRLSDSPAVLSPLEMDRAPGRNGPQVRSEREPKRALQWTCIVDFSVLVWHLSEIRTLLDRRRCLIIVPLDVIDRLDLAKKGHDKENQKAREAIRFLDERLNRSRGASPPRLVAQNIKDSLGRWSEAVPFLIEEEEPRRAATVPEDDATADPLTMKDVGEALSEEMVVDPGASKDELMEEEEEEIEVRNTMNVPRVWRPILGACLFMLRKREESARIKEERFVLLTEDPDLTYYAGWFDIPASTVHGWKHHGL